MKKRNKLNNKGFSLVELIIVIAIMAILVGAVTPQVIKYVEKSREAKDLQVLQTVFTAAQTAIMTDEVANSKTIQKTLKAIIDSNTEAYEKEIKELLGSDLAGKLTSKKAKETVAGVTTNRNIYIDYVDGKLEVGIGNAKPGSGDAGVGIGPITN